MLTATWAIQGGRVHSALKGQEITFKIPENYTEAETQTKGGQSDVVAKFADGLVIAKQGKLRTMAEKVNADGTPKYALTDLQKAADEYVYSVQAEGTPKSIKPQTAKQRTEQGVGNRLFERMASDDKFKSQMFKAGVADEETFNAWVAARDAAVAAAAPVAPTPTETEPVAQSA